jgi:hypothetical protein
MAIGQASCGPKARSAYASGIFAYRRSPFKLRPDPCKAASMAKD